MPGTFNPWTFAPSLAMVVGLPEVAARAPGRAALSSTTCRAPATTARPRTKDPAQQVLAVQVGLLPMVLLELPACLTAKAKALAGAAGSLATGARANCWGNPQCCLLKLRVPRSCCARTAAVGRPTTTATVPALVSVKRLMYAKLVEL